MPRGPQTTKKIEFQPGSIMVGRTVRTATYSNKLVNLISHTDCDIPAKDISGWCGLNFTVVGVNHRKGTVLLKYNIPNTTHQTTSLLWPIEGLSKSFGIRI